MFHNWIKKRTISHDFTFIKIVNHKSLAILDMFQWLEKREFSFIAFQNIKEQITLESKLSGYFFDKLNVCLLYDLAISRHGIYSREIKPYVHT